MDTLVEKELGYLISVLCCLCHFDSCPSDPIILINYIFILNHTMLFHTPMLPYVLPVCLELSLASCLPAKLLLILKTGSNGMFCSFCDFTSNMIFSLFKYSKFHTRSLVIDNSSDFFTSHSLSPSTWHNV